jgi:hypothetical protein
MKNWLGLINIYNTGEGGRISQTLSSSVRTGGACVFLAPKNKKRNLSLGSLMYILPLPAGATGQAVFRHSMKQWQAQTTGFSHEPVLITCVSLSLSCVCLTFVPLCSHSQRHASHTPRAFHKFTTSTLCRSPKFFFLFLTADKVEHFFFSFFLF